MISRVLKSAFPDIANQVNHDEICVKKRGGVAKIQTDGNTEVFSRHDWRLSCYHSRESACSSSVCACGSGGVPRSTEL